MRLHTLFVAFLLLASTALTGCTQMRSNVVATPMVMERVTFSTPAERTDVIDAAAATLIANNFSITMVNDRFGLLQTDYVTLTSIPGTVLDSLAHVGGLDKMMMRVTINMEERAGTQHVVLKGTYQRLGKTTSQGDNLIGLYWLERVAEEIAHTLGATYVAQVSDGLYIEAMEGRVQAVGGRGYQHRPVAALRAVGIVAAVIFASSLAIGTFGPSTGR